MNNQMKIIILTLLAFILLLAGNNSKAQTSNSQSLSGTWEITWSDGGHGPRKFDALAGINPKVDPKKYLKIEVPGEIHDVFQKEGVIGDPNLGVNTLSANWVADQYYQYYHTFNLPEDASGKELWLVFDELDLVADIYLNGKHIGHHQNLYYPCRLNVTKNVRSGENVLVVLLESGLYSVAEKEGYKYGYERGLQQAVDKRHYLRKPQYQFNWDWNPKYINVGITGDVRLEWAEKLRLDQMSFSPHVSDDLKKANISVKSFIEGLAKNQQFELEVQVKETGKTISKNFELKKGINQYQLDVEINQPNLWWPIDQGDQFRYTLVTNIKMDGEIIASETRKIGLRKVEVDQSAHPEVGNYFTIKINNRPIFMKGANWVPPELTYSHITDQKLDSLMQLAIDANFNMLRVWGGGTYAGNHLLDICDEKGVLVWHDFLFACSLYPGDDDEFYDEIRREVTWNVRKYSHHASMIVWGGNNENEWIYWDEYKDKMPMVDYVIYEHLLPLVLKQEKINAFYWPASPHSEDKIFPNHPHYGDQHPWGVGFGKEDVDFYAYRKYDDRFADEGGFLGASSPATLKQMLGEEQYYLRSFAWDHHDNLQNFRNNKIGYTYRAYKFFFGKNYDEVDFDDYIFGSSLLHAEALQEYIANYHRRKFSSSAAVFWMYADSWPVTHGWTIVDYYLRKKLAYHPVRRAFANIATIIAEEGDKIKVYGANDSTEEWKGELNYGVFTCNGEKPLDKKLKVKIPANTSVVLAEFPADAIKKIGVEKSGGFAVLKKDGKTVSQNKLLLNYFKDIQLITPTIDIKLVNGQAIFTSDQFVWGVAIDLDGEEKIADNCFDLIPGIPYSIPWDSNKKPQVKRTGNELLVKFCSK